MPIASGVGKALTGRYEPRLDNKSRFTVPARWYERMGSPESVYVSQSFTSKTYLGVFAEGDFEKRLQPLRSRPLSDEKARDFLRVISNRTVLIPVDAQNRIRIPDNFLQYAGIKSDLVLSGSDEHFEVWSAANLPKERMEDEQRAADNVQCAKELGF